MGCLWLMMVIPDRLALGRLRTVHSQKLQAAQQKRKLGTPTIH